MRVCVCVSACVDLLYLACLHLKSVVVHASRVTWKNLVSVSWSIEGETGWLIGSLIRRN